MFVFGVVVALLVKRGGRSSRSRRSGQQKDHKRHRSSRESISRHQRRRTNDPFGKL
jgi:hypothetical protein